MSVEPLREACELAFAVARHGRESVPAVEAPAPMRSFLWVAQLPPRAITVAQRVIESDDTFRLRVAAEATEANVGRPGYLWLTRPPGWEAEYGIATGQGGPAPSRHAAQAPAPQTTAPLPQAGQPQHAASPPAPPPRPAAGATPPIPPRPAVQAPSQTQAQASAPGSAPIPPRPSHQRSPRPASAAASQPAPVPAPNPERLAGSQAAIGDELASLRNLVDRLGDERQDVAAAATSEARMARRLSADTRSVEALEQDLITARAERDAARSDRADATSKIDDLQRQIESFDHERILVKDSLSSAEKTTSAAVAERHAAEAEREAAVAQREAAEAERQAAEAERDRALTELGELRADRSAIEERLRLAEQAKLDAEMELRKLSTQWSAIRAEMDEIADQRLKVEAELDRLSQARVVSVHDNAELFKRLTDQLGHVEAERNMLAAQLETARVRMADTRSALSDASANWTRHLDAADAAIGDISETVGSLSSEIAQVNETRGDLDALITEADNAASHPEPIPDEPVTRVVAADYDAFDGVDEDYSMVIEDTVAASQPIPPMPPIPTVDEIPPMPAAPVLDEIPPMPAPPLLDRDGSELDDVSPVDDASESFAEEPVMAAPFDPGRPVRTQIRLSPDARLDAALAAREVVQTIDVVVLVDGDAVAEMGWPTLTLTDRRAAIVEYLEGLAASTGAAAHVIFDRQRGGEEAKPESKAIRVELTLPQMSPSSSMAMRIDDYPVEWPVTVVSDDAALASEAASRGASQLGNGQLLDLFIGQ